MDNHVLEYLKELRDALPSDTLIKDNSTRSSVVESLTKKILEVEDKLQNIENLDLSEIKNDEIDTINSDLEDTYDELENARLELVSTESSISLYKNEVNQYNHEIEMNRRLVDKASTEEDKTRLNRRIEETKKLIERNENLIASSNEVVTKLKRKIGTLERNIDTKSKDLQNARKEEIKNISEKYDQAYSLRLGQVMSLRQKLGFINVDVKPMLDSLIEDYESGKTNNEEVNYRMNMLKNNLSDPRVNALTQLYSREQSSLAVDELDSINSNIRKLSDKLSNDDNYILSEEEYRKKYNKLSKELIKQERLYDSKRTKFDDLVDKISNIKVDMENAISEDSKEVLAKEQTRLESMLSKLEERYVESSVKVQSVRDELNSLVIMHNKVNIAEQERDIKALEDLKVQRTNAEYLKSLDYMSINKRIDTLIQITDSESKKNDTPVIKENVEPPVLGEGDKGLTKPTKEIEPPVLSDEDKNLTKPTKEVEPPVLTDDDKNLLKPVKPKANIIKNIKDASDKLKANRKKIIIGAAAAIVAIAAIVGVSHVVKNNKDDKETETKTDDKQIETVVTTPTPVPVNPTPVPVKEEDRIYLDVNDFIETKDTFIDADGNVTNKNDGSDVGTITTYDYDNNIAVVDSTKLDDVNKDEKKEEKEENLYDPSEGINWDWSSILEEDTTKTM